jgi:hypothetical protein
VGAAAGPGRGVKTRLCGSGESARRLAAARQFLAAASLSLDDPDTEAARVTVSNAVTSGIAAADAIRCARLGRHAVGDEHQAAAELLEGCNPGGASASRALAWLLSVKTKAQHQTEPLRPAEARGAVRRAAALVAAAEQTVRARA